MDDSAQGPRPFAVDDSQIQNPLLQAGLDIVLNERTDLGRAKGMEIEYAVHGNLKDFVVTGKLFAHGISISYL